MKVTRIETTPLVLPLEEPILSALGTIRCFGCILIHVHTDEGIVGENFAFTLNDQRTSVLREMIDSLAPLIVGFDPEYTTAFWSRAWTAINFLGHTGVPVVGISAIERALWDIVGKSLGRPLHRVLGGARDTVPTYHSGGLWLSRTVGELVEEADLFVSQGFRAMKLRVGSPNARDDIERVRAVRQAIGPGVALMVDANQGLNESQAIRLGRMLEEFDLTWFEEPLPAWDLAGLARVAAALDTPIASGETEYTRYGFRRMLELRSADILMPDLQRVGGVTEFMRVAHHAAAYDIPVSSHLFPEQSVQLLGSLSNASYLEYMPWFASLYNETLELRDGHVVVPERPGWGFTLDAGYVKKLKDRH